MNFIDKSELNKMINNNYNKLVFIYEQYETEQTRIVSTTKLPIQMIDNVNVNVYIKIYKKAFILDIKAKTIIVNGFHYTYYRNELVINNYDLTFVDYIIAYMKLQYILHNYRFNNYLGIFEDKKNFKNIAVSLHNVFNTKNIKLINDECCVCMELTRNKTKCNHTICYICWDTIKRTRNDDEFLHKQCPMCRECIDYYKEDLDDNLDDYDEID